MNLHDCETLVVRGNEKSGFKGSNYASFMAKSISPPFKYPNQFLLLRSKIFYNLYLKPTNFYIFPDMKKFKKVRNFSQIALTRCLLTNSSLEKGCPSQNKTFSKVCQPALPNPTQCGALSNFKIPGKQHK
jgi:hypothetical protein